MVGGVIQGSEKKKASVGLFSTFRHPLGLTRTDSGSSPHTVTVHAFTPVYNRDISWHQAELGCSINLFTVIVNDNSNVVSVEALD